MYSVAADTLMVPVAARSAFPTREHAIAYIYIYVKKSISMIPKMNLFGSLAKRYCHEVQTDCLHAITDK